MTINGENAIFAQIAQKIEPQSTLLRAWQLQGGISAQVTALEIERPDGQVKKLIVRQHGDEELQSNPRITTDEFKLLQILQTAGLATPAPYHLDQSGELFAAPYIVIEYIEGQSEFALASIPDLIVQFAAHLARIHQVDCSQLDLSFLPRQDARYARKVQTRPAQLDESLQEGQIRGVLEAVWPIPQHNPSALLHGDYWPGNVLWRDGQLVAVIDWEDAEIGDPLADVANSRMELLWAFGSEAMEHFTQQYQTLSTLDFTNLPYWDLCAALRPASQLAAWAGDEIREQDMRAKHKWFVSQAFQQLAVQ